MSVFLVLISVHSAEGVWCEVFLRNEDWVQIALKDVEFY